MALRVRFITIPLYRHIVQNVCRTTTQCKGCATSAQSQPPPPKAEEEETIEVENTQSKQVRKFEKEKSAAELNEEWRQTIHWRMNPPREDNKPVDPRTVPIEERKPIGSMPLQPGDKPSASNFVIPLPPPPVPVDPYFQDRDLPSANAVTSTWEASTAIYDNKRTVPFQDWWHCKHGEIGTPFSPLLVPSLYDKRVVTCCCAPEDTSIIYYILVHRGYTSRCPGCGNCFVLLSSKNCEVRKGV